MSEERSKEVAGKFEQSASGNDNAGKNEPALYCGNKTGIAPRWVNHQVHQPK